MKNGALSAVIDVVADILAVLDAEQIDALVVTGTSIHRALIVNWTPESHTIRIDGSDPVAVDPSCLTILELPARN